MSFGIVRIQKCKRQAVTGIGIHNQRQKEKSNTNPDIDRTKSQENYYLEGEGVSFTAEVNRRLEGASGSRWGTIRKDAVVLAEALVTSDSSFFASLPPEKQKTFFSQSLDFLKQKYGAENIFSAVVHLDEATPHMHVSFVPIKDGKLSAKTLFSREALSDLQTTFFEQVGKQWGLQRGEKHTAKRKHLATPDFKRLTAEGLAQMSISPQDLEPKVLEKRLLKTTVETKGEVAKRLSKKYILPLVKELQKLLLEVKAQEALARSREGAFQEKKELEKGLNATQRTLLKTATKALSKKLKKDRETLERQYGEAICKLIKPESPSVATQYKEYDEYLDKLQAATPEERTALLDRLRHAEHRYKVQELFYKVAERTSRDTSISGRTQERDAMLAEWDKADPYQRIQMEHDADVFVAQTKPLSRGYHR